MANIFDVPDNELMEKAAVELKKIEEVMPPEWAGYVKTGAHKERPPVRKDWWYIRTASVLRIIYKLGPIGVSKLRTRYGGKKNRGMKPEKFYKASGNILRKILQQLEKIDFVKQGEKGNHKGRIITPKGKSFLDKIATQILSTKPKIKKISKVPKEEAPKVEKKIKVEKEHKKIVKKKPVEKKKAVKKKVEKKTKKGKKPKVKEKKTVKSKK